MSAHASHSQLVGCLLLENLAKAGGEAIGICVEEESFSNGWTMAFGQATASKKGCSAKELERMTGVSYKSALFVLHRIRWGMVETDGAPLTGAVEVDETFVGASRGGYPAAAREDH